MAFKHVWKLLDVEVFYFDDIRIAKYHSMPVKRIWWNNNSYIHSEDLFRTFSAEEKEKILFDMDEFEKIFIWE